MKGKLRFRALGIAYMAMLLACFLLVVAIFGQKFTTFDKVELRTATIGLSMPDRADVKVRGVIVGQVLEAKPAKGGKSAILTLGLDPDKIGTIPDNVTASLLPKTLFGEKYVELSIPRDASTSSLKAGDVISQTALPVELEKILNDIYPLLTAVQPGELNYTLNALATAFEGRGEELGQTIATLDRYLNRLNPQVPALMEDLRKLSTVSNVYADAMPELAATLRNTVVTGNTLKGRQAALNAFLKDTTAFSNTATRFTRANGQNIIQLGKVSEPVLALLRHYSPEFPCLFQGLAKQVPLLDSAFRNATVHVNLELVPQSKAYTAADQPKFADYSGPNCAGLPNPPGDQANPYGGPNSPIHLPNFNDGYALNRVSPEVEGGLNTRTIGSADQKQVVNAMTAPVLGMPAAQVPDLVSLLFTPMAAGSQVNLR